MKIHHEHAWDVGPAEAIKIQKQLTSQVITGNTFDRVKFVAGVDVGFEKNNTITRAAVAVLDIDTLSLVDRALYKMKTTFPYVPGLLSFREIPATLEAFRRLSQFPDLILCDGQGLAHPRRFGIASHLGVLLDVPTIGVAKTRLIGTHDEVPNAKGHSVKLYDKGECIGAVLRTRVNVKPLYISIGHRISLDTALQYVMRCVTKYRLPETTRYAHRLASNV